jgi:hypothetical protein
MVSKQLLISGSFVGAFGYHVELGFFNPFNATMRVIVSVCILVGSKKFGELLPTDR